MQNSWRQLSPNSVKLPESTQNTPNSALNSKYHTIDTDHAFTKSKKVEESYRNESTITVDMSDVYLEAKIQLPTRFRSREKMMAHKRPAPLNLGKPFDEKSSKSHIIEDIRCQNVSKNIVESEISDFAFVFESGECMSFSEKDHKRNTQIDSSKATTRIDAEAVRSKLRNKWNK